jgi:hypothetical protein
MKIITKSLLALLVFTAAAVASVDPALLNLVPPDAKLVSGIQVEQSKASPFGRYVLSQMGSGNADLTKFIAATGFDPRSDLSELLVATAGTVEKQAIIVFGRGVFNPVKIASLAKNSGATLLNYKGIDLITHKDAKSDNSVAFLTASTAAMGNTDAVKAAIDRSQTGPFLSADIQAKVRDLAAVNDAWFLSTGPITNLFAGKMPDQNLNQAMNWNLLQAVLQANGGIKFGVKEITISAEALTRSGKDASALADVIRFVAGLVQMNKDKTPQAERAASLLDTLQLSTEASTMKLSLSIPEDIAEKLIMPQEKNKTKPRGTTAQLR